MRNHIEIAGRAIAMDPVHQGGDRSGGTVAEMNRMRVKIGDGEFDFLPYISANSIAGILRDCCAFWCLDQIDYPLFTGESAIHVFDLLTSGGGRVAKATGPGYIDLQRENELRSLFPVLGLFGCSIGNRMIAGRLQVGDWIPICAEMKTRLPESLWDRASDVHIEDLIGEQSYTTRDDKKNRYWQDRLDPETLREWQRQNEAADLENRPKAAPISMRYTLECFVPGTEFYVHFRLLNPSDVELGAFLGALGYFSDNPKIGGRGNRGFGRVRLELNQYRLAGFERVEGPLAVEAIGQAREHLRANRERIVEMIEGGLL